MAADPARYEGTYSDDSSYGSAVRLAARGERRGVVLDLGCGYGPVAEPLRDLGFTYVGLDAEAAGLESLAARGFEIGTIDLEAPAAELRSRLRDALGDRPLAVVLMLDVLEHLRGPEDCLEAVTEVARSVGDVELVLSLPNVTHTDIIGKALLGRWERTAVGLLDRTHVQLFGEHDAVQLATGRGWIPVDAEDVYAEVTEQCTPIDAPHLRPGAPLRDLLATLRRRADGHGATYQFVRRYRLAEGISVATEPAQPLLAVVLAGEAAADEMLRADLAAQMDADVRVIEAVPGDDLAAAAIRSGARYAVVLRAGTRLSPHWLAGLRRDIDFAPGRVIASGCSELGTDGPRMPLATLELLGTVVDGRFAAPAYALPVAAFGLGGFGPLGPTDGDLAVTVARCTMWCGRYDSPDVTVAVEGAVPAEEVLDQVVAALDAEPLLHAPGALAPAVALARAAGHHAAAEASLRLQLDQLQRRHELLAHAQETELARLHAVIARQSTPWGALAFATRRWTSAILRRLAPGRRRTEG